MKTYIDSRGKQAIRAALYAEFKRICAQPENEGTPITEGENPKQLTDYGIAVVLTGWLGGETSYPYWVLNPNDVSHKVRVIWTGYLSHVFPQDELPRQVWRETGGVTFELWKNGRRPRRMYLQRGFTPQEFVARLTEFVGLCRKAS